MKKQKLGCPLKFTGRLAFSEVKFDTSDELDDVVKEDIYIYLFIFIYMDDPVTGAKAIAGMRSERSPGKEVCKKGDMHT